jgi:hypothetical protein
VSGMAGRNDKPRVEDRSKQVTLWTARRVAALPPTAKLFAPEYLKNVTSNR